MLAKMTSKNQITIPKKIIEKMPGVEHFDVEYKDGVVILKPIKFFNTNLDQIRSKIKKLGLSENSVAEAIEWVKSKQSESS
ncbi:MAG: AbrB/MazE/SpoVT family DNA-binding domain-containing protein [Desulfobacterales bacterium]|nr:MAG: AbrB/MazE/SpoVT family DNA-binding domain-containing protein [Desulfobacterales bacterium]